MHRTDTRPPAWAQPGILHGDIEGARRRHPSRHPEVIGTPGLEVHHNGSGQRGVVISIRRDAVVLRLSSGGKVTRRLSPGAFRVDGRNVTLVPPRESAPSAPTVTRSGSIAAPTSAPAKVARASRIWVEGRHDAELIEKVWGDDLRHVGVVVEPMHGVDDVLGAIDDFQPGPQRRLGLLLDHLVPGSKEQRIADGIRDQNVLVLGHPFVDVWEAVKPEAAGIGRWPVVPKGQDWKTGVCSALGVENPGRFWGLLLGRVNSFTDLDVALINSVERLIDFVTVEDD